MPTTRISGVATHLPERTQDTADTEVVEPQAVTEAMDESAADVAEKAATDQAKKDATQA